MPRNELLSFKNDPDAMFAAQFIWLSTHADAEDKAITENFTKYRSTINNKLKELDPDSREFILYNQIIQETENLNQLILHYALNSFKDERLTRDILVDATKSIKRLQGLQDSLENAGFGIAVMGDHVNGPWGCPKYTRAYAETMRRCNEGKNLISQKFNENSAQVVADFDEVMNAPIYDHRAYKLNKVTHNKTYLMSAEEFESYMASRRPAVQEQIEPDQAAPVDLDGSLQPKNTRDMSYTIDKDRIEVIQCAAREILINTCINSTKNDTHGLYRDMCNLRDDLLKFHYDVKNNNVQANEKINYLDGLLSDRNIEKDNNDKYKLKMNLQNPEQPKFLDNLVYFISDLESQKEKVDAAREPDANWFESFFKKGQDGDCFYGILSGLKAMQSDPNVPDTFKTKCKPILNKLENLAKKAFDNIEVDGMTPFEKYVAMNSGDFNFGKGQAAVDGVAKVTAAYEWQKKNVRQTDPAKKETFDPEKIDKLAVEMKANPVFKTFYKGPQDGTWSEVSLSMNVKGKKEWMINNMIDNPFASTRREQKLAAIKKLQELGKILPDPAGASSDYHRFNSLLKGLSEKNTDRLSEGQMNYILKNVFDENEKYMKGRKSARFKDASKEHFEETLDVLKIYSDMDEYGKAMAKKLVDRTNYVRTHRWHHLSEQEKVTLDGRSIAATKARIDVLINGKKPAPKGPAM